VGIVTGIAVDTLTKKVGPLPIWVWAVLVGGGAGVVLLMRSHSNAAASASDTGSTDTTGTPSDVADSSGTDPYSNYLDTGGLYNGYGASDLGSYGSSGAGGAPYYPYPTSQAPQTVTAKLDPALLAELKAIQKALAARRKPKPKPKRKPKFSSHPPHQAHTAFQPAAHRMTGGGQTRRNVESHFVA
jgi:hypothetical protein